MASISMPPSTSYPAISVIIPLYNAEKYLGECLDSILAQTFQDFELVIVDDCSTDSSCEIVESYIPKFNGRLKLYHTEKNTGSGVVARNIGLSKASGEYVYNMDNDDVITTTALEEMYSLAKEYDADVVYCERFYEQDKNGNIKIRAFQSGDVVEKPTLESFDIKERVQAILDNRYHSTPWLKLVQRNLLIEHEIFFPTLRISDDNIWTQGLVIYAKKILRVPNAVYTWRFNKDSISRVDKTPEEFINYYMNPVLLGLKYLDKLMSSHEFFKENPSYRYALLKYFVDKRFSWTLKSSMELDEDKIYETLKNEFGKNLGEYDVLISCLCARIYEKNSELDADQLKLNQTKQLQENQRVLAEKDAEINRLRAALAFQISLLPQASYAISVIIPLYNAAEYVGQCLESLLIQTFQDFEVIVVDDCSTDNSVAIVESYRPKFNGRLKLTKTEKNSGGGGYVPRNIGFKLASGKYVYFMDADDFLLGTALEIFYTTAEKHAVDVVYTAVAYKMKKINDAIVWRDSKTKGTTSKLLEGEEFNNFLHGLAFEGIFTYPWVYFVRRDFLLQNNIAFPEIMKAGDYLWAVTVCCQTKKIFRLVKPLYFHNEYNVNSVSRFGSAIISHSKWVLAFTDFIKALNEMACKFEFLSNNPDYVYGIAGRYFKIIVKSINETNKSLSNQEIFEALYYGDRSDLMIPFFFRNINAQQKELTDDQAVFRKFRPHIFSRIDVRFLSTTGNCKILSVSDDKAELSKPPFLQKGGDGYIIQSCVGTLNFIAKATADGKIQLKLRGLDVRDPADKTKRIPYWIDYTKLIINGKILFDTITPIWHDKPYLYNMDVKADEEIKIEVEWLPHRDDSGDVSANVEDIQAKSSAKDTLINKLQVTLDNEKKAADKQKVLIAELQTALDTEKKIHSDDAELIRKFSDYFTSRIDLRLVPNSKGKLQIVSLSDEKATVKKAGWLPKNESGYFIQSYAGKMEIIAKPTADGQINLDLRGLDVRNPEDRSKKIPYWIDYTKLVVNGEVLFDELTPVWHNKPFRYKLDVKADEEIKIAVEWQPHRSN